MYHRHLAASVLVTLLAAAPGRAIDPSSSTASIDQQIDRALRRQRAADRAIAGANAAIVDAGAAAARFAAVCDQAKLDFAAVESSEYILAVRWDQWAVRRLAADRQRNLDELDLALAVARNTAPDDDLFGDLFDDIGHAFKTAGVAVKNESVKMYEAERDGIARHAKFGFKVATITYCTLSDATHQSVDTLRVIDRHTVQPFKHLAEDYALKPAWKATRFVADPVVEAGNDAIDFADSTLAMDGTLIPGGRYLDDGLGWVGAKLGVDPDVAKMLDPLYEARRVFNQVAQDAPPFIQTAAVESWSAISADPTAAVGAGGEIVMASLAMSGNVSMSVVRPVIVAYGSGLMYQAENAEEVHDEGVVQDAARPPIYFINGVRNDFKSAKSSAAALSAVAQTSVRLIWNEGDDSLPRTALSSAEGAYDRVSNLLAVGPLRAFNGDSTCRRITGAIRENAKAGRDMIIVAHSQGALQTLGALQAANALGLGRYIRQHVRVVLAGVPFVKAEIQPKPNECWCLQNPHDGVAGLIGGNLTNPTSGGHGHGFVEHYLPSIDPAWLR